MDKWNVLPTDQRYIDLTEEQRSILWEDYLFKNPEIVRKIELSQDESFDKEYENIKNNEENHEEDWEEVVETYESFLTDNKELNVEYSDETRRILESISQNQADQERVQLDPDWEEEVSD